MSKITRDDIQRIGDKEIDVLVYDLYELIPAEIALIEEESNQ